MRDYVTTRYFKRSESKNYTAGSLTMLVNEIAALWAKKEPFTFEVGEEVKPIKNNLK